MYQISWKSFQWDSNFFMRTKERTEKNMTKLIVVFCNFANAPKNQALWRRILQNVMGIYLNN
jgi:hypothetical protein